LLNNIFKVSFTKRKQKSTKQRFVANNKKSKINISNKESQNNNVFNTKFSQISQISCRFCQLLKKIVLNVLQKISSRDIVFLSNSKKQKKSIYLNNCNLSTINIARRIFNYNFSAQEDTQARERKKEQKKEREKEKEIASLFIFRN